MFCIDVFDIQNYIFTIEFLFVTYKLRVFVDGLIVVCLTYMTVLLFLWMSACHHAQRNCLPYQCVGHDSNSPFQTICIFITNNYIFYFWKKKKVLSFLFKSELDIATWCLFAIANLGNNIYGLFQPMVFQVHANKVSFIEERDWGRGDI